MLKHQTSQTYFNFNFTFLLKYIFFFCYNINIAQENINLHYYSNIYYQKKGDSNVTNIINEFDSWYSYIQKDDYENCLKMLCKSEELNYSLLYKIIDSKRKYNYSNEVKPTIINIEKVDNNKYNVVFSLNNKIDNVDNLLYIFKLRCNIDNNNLCFESLFFDNIKSYKKDIYNGIVFFYKNEINKDKIKENAIFNEFMSDFFQLPIINYTYIKNSIYSETLKLIGFDFDTRFYLNNAKDSFAISNLNYIFSSNDSEINKHEIVHLYTNKKFNNISSKIDEGLSSYFGGSLGINYLKLKEELYDFLLTESEFDLRLMYFKYDNYPINEYNLIKQSFGAVICEYYLKYLGKEKLFNLISFGNDNNLLEKTILNDLKIKESEFNSFWKNFFKNEK